MAGEVSAVALCELASDVSWLRVTCGLRGQRPWFWLDSARLDARLGRFSFAGAEPSFVLRAFGTRCEVERGATRRTVFGDPLEVARGLLPRAPAAGVPLPLPFVGGAVALLAYELGDLWEALPPAPPDPLAPPDLVLLGVERLYACDHLDGRVYAVALATAPDRAQAERRARREAQRLAAAPPDGDASLLAVPPGPPTLAPVQAHSNLEPEAYAKAVAQVRDHIAAGDVYQACLTRRLDARLEADPFELYVALRRRSPAPFAAFVALPELAVASSSPERFLRVTPGRWAETRPIKGTRPRGATPESDAALRAELAASEKDRAENLMIVDLARNDLGRVCEPGSVHVPELFAVEGYATVFQLVSTVRGRLAAGEDAWSAVRAAFPPGSMTGAPKVAAMSLLRALEPARRGFYAGALGYFDVRGGCDLSVVIRTCFARGEHAWLHTGGGVVHDSEPRGEWEESEHKARALLEALAEARR